MVAGLVGVVVGEARGMEEVTRVWERGRVDGVVGGRGVEEGDWEIVSEEHWEDGVDAKVVVGGGGMGECEGSIGGV